MSNFDTIQAITKNLETALSGLGVKFSLKCYDDAGKSTPASVIPRGEFFYNGEVPENTHGERPSYIEAEYMLKVILNHLDSAKMVRAQQEWFHLIRAGVTVNALNSGALAASKLVSKVITESATPENDGSSGLATFNYRVKIRYREL